MAVCSIKAHRFVVCIGVMLVPDPLVRARLTTSMLTLIHHPSDAERAQLVEVSASTNTVCSTSLFVLLPQPQRPPKLVCFAWPCFKCRSPSRLLWRLLKPWASKAQRTSSWHRYSMPAAACLLCCLSDVTMIAARPLLCRHTARASARPWLPRCVARWAST